MRVTALADWEIEAIGEAFADHPYTVDDQGMAMLFPDRESTKAYICGYVRAVLKCKSLYTTSEKHEAFIVFCHTQDKYRLRFLLSLVPVIVRNMGFGGAMRYMKLVGCSGKSYHEELAKAKKPHVYVALLAVTKPWQGQGYMRKVIDIAYEEGRRRHCPVVLETDAKLKRDKYVSVGMTCVKERRCSDTAALYDMVWEESR